MGTTSEHNKVLYFIMEQEWPCMTHRQKFITILILNVATILLIIMGLTLQISLRPFEPQYRFEYIGSSTDCFPGSWCTKEIQIESRMTKGRYRLHYTLNKFYQNNRSFYWSYSVLQLKHKSIKDTIGCGAESKHEQRTIYPCGKIANTIFRDDLILSYKLTDGTTWDLTINKISSLNTSYKGFIKNYSTDEIKSNSMYRQATFLPNIFKSLIYEQLDMELPMPEDINFIIWLKPSLTSKVVKPLGHIELNHDLVEESKVIIKFQNNSILNGNVRSLLFTKGNSLVNNTLLLIIELMAISFGMVETLIFFFKGRLK